MQIFCMTYIKPCAKSSRSATLLFLFFSVKVVKYLAVSHAPSTQAQLTDSRWTLAKRILTPHRVKAWVFTQRSRWSSILFRQASKHTAWTLSNYPPAKMRVCHHCFVHSSFNLIWNFDGTREFILLHILSFSNPELCLYCKCWQVCLSVFLKLQQTVGFVMCM